ncbi:MAG: GNAT family N-acetyltransferase [Phenylobacterium sp.]|uniref:GNAT family N-acetyltransferase n=1 Tax=Phenylobacterium sp. TaxID=1871053 RepID=UPI00391D1720
MEVRAYTGEDRQAWNALNRAAGNGHFLFDRGFMDYHADRFSDASLMALDDGRPIALLPANRDGDAVWSHQGLTFGGLIHEDLGATRALEVLDAFARRLRSDGASSLVYKATPWIYPSRPAQEDLYWLFRREAQLIRRDVSVAIDYRAPGPASRRRRRGARTAEKAGATYERSTDFAAYWALLESVLGDRHGARPVHSEAEIRLLAERFPEEIALHVALIEGEVAAGVVMFCTPTVAHAQYIAASDRGREHGALDGLFFHLIEFYSASRRFFDFGISNTDQGRSLNEGLVRQKEEFGASAVVHDFYRVEL